MVNFIIICCVLNVQQNGTHLTSLFYVLIKILCLSDRPTTLNISVAEYADHKKLVLINTDPYIASLYLQSHLNIMED